MKTAPMANTEETNIVRRILLKCGSILGTRLFRNNSGSAWIGKSVMIKKREQIWVNAGDVVVQNARFFQAGLCTGSSDIIGFKSVTITTEMVGNPVAVFVACEAKTTSGRVSKEQLAFIKMINKNGGIAFIATDENMALEFLNGKF
jgi:hypothetical protein